MLTSAFACYPPSCMVAVRVRALFARGRPPDTNSHHARR